jgi:hypothetical protein
MMYTLEDTTLYSYFLMRCVCHIKPILDTGLRHTQYLIWGGGGSYFPISSIIHECKAVLEH